jgi:hypothetical protein
MLTVLPCAKLLSLFFGPLICLRFVCLVYVMMLFRLLLSGFCCLSATQVSAAIISFDLLDPTGVGGTAGEAFESGSPFTASGLTIAVAGTTTLGSTTGVYSANTSEAGFNSGGLVADQASGLDFGETLTFTLNFAGLNVSFASIDFSGIGSSSADSAFVAVSGGAPAELFTTVPGFNGTTDVWTPSGGLTIANNDTIVVTASDVVFLERISFDVTAVPEPSTFAFLGLLTGGVMAHRVRRRRRNQPLLPTE